MLPYPVSAVIINFRTPDLLERAVRSVRRFYPDLPLLLIDNGSGDTSASLLQKFRNESHATTEILLNSRNRHHGPAMDQALRHLQTPYVFFLDSDAEILNPGLLEGMFSVVAADPQHYAVGNRIFMNPRGFDVPESPDAKPYIRPICMVIHRDRYLALPPFEKHGAPCLRNFSAAVSKGYHLIHFPVEQYIAHKGRGTAAAHGYRLGFRGRLNHLLNRLGL